MAIIDKKGKLLGIINIIDLFVLASFIILATVVVFRFTGAQEMRHEIGSTPVTLTVMINEVRMETVDAIQVGDVVRDNTGGQVFGTITQKDYEVHRKQVSTAEGEIVWAEVPDRYSIYLTIESKGHDLNHVLRVSSYEIRVGTRVSFYAKDYSVSGNVLDYQVGN